MLPSKKKKKKDIYKYKFMLEMRKKQGVVCFLAPLLLMIVLSRWTIIYKLPKQSKVCIYKYTQ